MLFRCNVALQEGHAACAVTPYSYLRILKKNHTKLSFEQEFVPIHMHQPRDGLKNSTHSTIQHVYIDFPQE